jgi:hypothetical protein
MPKIQWTNPLLAVLWVAMGLLGCQSSNYLPLREGLTWDYLVTVRQRSANGDEQRPITGPTTVTALKERTLAGQQVTPMRYDIGGQVTIVFFAEDASGIFAFAQQPDGADEPEIRQQRPYVLRYPLRTGSAWPDFLDSALFTRRVSLSGTSTIQTLEEVVTVPAGTFKHCVKVFSAASSDKAFPDIVGTTVATEMLQWFAPGVGLVKMVQHDRSNRTAVGGGEIMMELKSYQNAL